MVFNEENQNLIQKNDDIQKSEAGVNSQTTNVKKHKVGTQNIFHIK